MKKGALFTTIGSIIILIISFIAFVLPSQLGSAQESSKKVFGKYKNREIVYEKNSDLVNNLQSIQNNYYNTYGQEPDNAAFYDNFYKAFRTTVLQYSYEEAVKKSGYVVADETVNRQVRSYFEDSDGKFSNDLYKQTDADTIVQLKEAIINAGYSNRAGEDLLGSQTENIGSSTLYGLKVSDDEVKFIMNFDTDLRSFNMVTFKKSDYPDSEVRAFADKNANLFTKYDLSIITFDSKSAADKAAKKIADGKATFEEVAAEGTNSYCDSENKLVYPYYYQYRLEKVLNDAADVNTIASLSKDSVSAVIELTDGYAIFRNNGAAEKADFDNEATFKDVRTYVSSYEAPAIEDYYLAKAKEFKAEAAKTSFDEACESLGLTKTDIPAFSLNYGGSSFGTAINSSLPALQFADTNETFLKTAFSLKENEISDPLVMADNTAGYVIVIQYLPTEQGEPADDSMRPFLMYQITSYDNIAATNKVMQSKDVTDNFIRTYYGY